MLGLNVHAPAEGAKIKKKQKSYGKNQNRLEINTMRAKWVMNIAFMMVIIAIALHTTHAKGTQPGSDQNVEDFIANIPAGVKVIPDIAYREGKSTRLEGSLCNVWY